MINQPSAIAFKLAMENPQFVPPPLTKEKFREDYERYITLGYLFKMPQQLNEYLRDIDPEAILTPRRQQDN